METTEWKNDVYSVLDFKRSNDNSNIFARVGIYLLAAWTNTKCRINTQRDNDQQLQWLHWLVHIHTTIESYISMNASMPVKRKDRSVLDARRDCHSTEKFNKKWQSFSGKKMKLLSCGKWQYFLIWNSICF